MISFDSLPTPLKIKVYFIRGYITMQRIKTIKKILCLSSITITNLINAQDTPLNSSNNSVVQGAIKTLDQTIQTLKSSKQETDSIDELIVHSVNEISNAVKKISTEIPKEDLKAAEKVCKEEIKQAEKTFKSLFNHHKKNLGKNLNIILGKENKNKIIKEAESCVTSIQDKTNEAETKVSLNVLGEKLTAVEQPLLNALDNVVSTQD